MTGSGTSAGRALDFNSPAAYMRAALVQAGPAPAAAMPAAYIPCTNASEQVQPAAGCKASLQLSYNTLI